MHEPVLGIDLGTTFSAIAQWTDTGAEIMQNRQGLDTTPSAFLWIAPSETAPAQEIIGQTALNRGAIHPHSLVRFVKRKMGQASEAIALVSKGSQTSFTPIEVSAKILSDLYQTQVEKYPKDQFSSRGTVVTVPYHFKAHQCEATRKAAELAGINCIGLLQEPIAASLTYAWEMVRRNPQRVGEETILVFDLGGGTFDTTVFRLRQRQRDLVFEVLSTGGDAELGGMDFDEVVMNLACTKAGVDLSKVPRDKLSEIRSKLMLQGMVSKEGLSSAYEEFFSTSGLGSGIGDFGVDISRPEFERGIEGYLERIVDIVEGTLSAAGLTVSQIDRVVMVGGSSLIPSVRSLVETLFPNKMYSDINPHKAIAQGAALYAAFLDDPSVFGGTIEILTRTSHSLGLAVQGGRFHALITANQPAPIERVQSYTTTDEGDVLNLDIYQGSQPFIAQNTLIGTVTIPLQPEFRKAGTRVDVKFSIDKKQSLTITTTIGGHTSQAYLTYQ